MIMKKKHKHQRGLCLCEYTPALSDEAAVQIHEFEGVPNFV